MALSVIARLNLAPLDVFARAVIQYADTAAQRAAEDSADRLRGHTYWRQRTGKTARSFRVSRQGRAFYRVASGSPVAAFLNYGTKAHTIVPVKAKALRFKTAGGIRFAKRVQHPGTRALGFEAIEQTLSLGTLTHGAHEAVDRAKALAG